MPRDQILLSMLSTEPQGVTLMLDWLLGQGYPIGEAVVVHTSGEVIRPAIARLDAEFAAGAYPGIFYRRVPIMGRHGPVADILTEDDAAALLRTLYRTLRSARQAGQTIHLSLTSGRKTMAVYAMVAAQLLFGEHDRAWHMMSLEQWVGDEKSLHVATDSAVKVVPVPVLRWADAATVAVLLETDDPWEAIRRQQVFAHDEAVRRRRMFLEHVLTPAEREVMVLLVREGLDNTGLAQRLHKSEKTIANQLTQVYQKFEAWRGLPSGSGGGRAALIAEFAPYLAARMGSNSQES